MSIKKRLPRNLFPRGKFAGWQGIEKLVPDHEFALQWALLSLPLCLTKQDNACHWRLIGQYHLMRLPLQVQLGP